MAKGKSAKPAKKATASVKGAAKATAKPSSKAASKGAPKSSVKAGGGEKKADDKAPLNPKRKLGLRGAAPWATVHPCRTAA